MHLKAQSCKLSPKHIHYIYLSTYLSIHLSIYASVYLSIYLFMYVYVSLTVCLSNKIWEMDTSFYSFTLHTSLLIHLPFIYLYIYFLILTLKSSVFDAYLNSIGHF